jgi:general secretion pathway protein E
MPHGTEAAAASAAAAGNLADALGAWLVARGKLSAPALDRALRLQDGGAARFDQILAKLGLVSERDIAEALASCIGLELVAPADYPMQPLLEHSLTPKFLRQAHLLPLRATPDAIEIAMADPLDGAAVHAIELATGCRVTRRVAVPAELETAVERLYGAGRHGISAIEEDVVTRGSGREEDIERLRDMASEAPVIRLVNLLIGQAVEARASDIHIEPYESLLRARFRIDGVLHEVEAPSHRSSAAVISRIKIMAGLNIAERRLPQDGRIKLAVRGRDIDLRVSTLPTLHGEKVVMRILDRGALTLDFAALGFDDAVLPRYVQVLHQPHGILLVTGPTGSGKTTTLYTSLKLLNTSEVNILTVEEPIEYQFDGINQVQVKPQIGLTFVNALRAFLRQDPNIIMVGEIRDAETAQIAVRAALTGHLVLSTLHTNDAASTVGRLLDMHVEDYLVNSTLNGILAQRLVRTLCPECRQAYEAPAQLFAAARRRRPEIEPVLYRAVGCPACHGTGYRGRTMVLELMVMSDALRRLVLSHADTREFQRVAVEEGMLTLYEHGLLKAFAGITSVEEVSRVVRDA